MIREADQFAEEDKVVSERVKARNDFDDHLHSMRLAVEGSSENKSLGKKLDDEGKDKIQDALRDGQFWLDLNPEAEADEAKEKHKLVEGICAPIISKYYGGADRARTITGGEYIVITDTRSGVQRVEAGPKLAFLDAYEQAGPKMAKVILDNWKGTNTSRFKT